MTAIKTLRTFTQTFKVQWVYEDSFIVYDGGVIAADPALCKCLQKNKIYSLEIALQQGLNEHGLPVKQCILLGIWS